MTMPRGQGRSGVAKVPETMAAAVMHGPGDIRLEEVPVPAPQQAQVLVRIRATALCTFEQRVYAGSQSMSFPWVGGHETAAEVVAVGPDTATDLEPGDQVAVSHPSCGQCDSCRRGYPARCVGQDLRTKHHGLAGGWGLAQYRLASPTTLFRIDSTVPPVEASLAEPLSCAVHAVRAAQIDLADDVLIIGAGTMGLLNLLLCKLRGAKVMVGELDERRLAKARELGADAGFDMSSSDSVDAIRRLSGGLGVDVVIAAVGHQDVDRAAFATVRRTGKIVLFAACHPSVDLTVDHNLIHKGELKVIGAEGKNVDDFRIAAKLLSDRLVSMAPLVQAALPFHEIDKALKLASEPESYRVVVTW